MTVRIINADVMDGLRQLPDESVHCVVTSPPYWGLRDYGVAGQIGLERTPTGYVSAIRDVFTEVRRVLRKDGTCWVNLGDTYASSPPGNQNGGVSESSTLHGVNGHSGTYRETLKQSVGQKRNTVVDGLKPKDLCGVPWRVAFALQADGWWLRSDIIWSKPNPMPESVTDRPTKAHEYVFLLTKSERYYYDHEAIKEPLAYPDDLRRTSVNGHGNGQLGKSVRFGVGKNQVSHDGRKVGFNAPRDEAEVDGTAPNGRNKRSVWTMATAPFSEAHFATFPPELPEICIKAGCPVGGTVLDPFSGAGTTCLVADRLQRNAIGIELNPTYAAMSERRINGDRGALLDLMEAS